MLLLVRHGVSGFVFRQGLSMYLSFGGDRRVEGALLVGPVVVELSCVCGMLLSRSA